MRTLTPQATGTDEWDIASVDVDAYLWRIDHPQVTPSVDALRSLHEAHVRRPIRECRRRARDASWAGTGRDQR